MTVRSAVLTSLFVLSAAVLAASPAAAGGSFDFLFDINHVSNDNQLFLNVAVSNLGFGRAALEPVLPRVRYVDADLPVVLFLAQTSGRPVDFIVDLRARGATWSAIFTSLRVPPDVLFAGIDEDPGPPYGRAWGYWRHNPRGLRLSDGDVCDLVKIQLASRYAGVSALEVARGYQRGHNAPYFVAEKHGRPWGGGQGRGHGHDEGHGHGHGPDDDHGHGHGHGHGHPGDHGDHGDHDD